MPDAPIIREELIYKQFFVLHWVATEGPIYCKSEPPYGMTMTWLLQSGFVEVVPESPYLMRIEVTEAGRRALQAHEHMDLDDQMVDPFSDQRS